MPKSYVIVTVDTEASTFQDKPLTLEKRVYGEIDGEYYGIHKIMDICDNFGIKASFFVDVYEYKYFGEEKLRSICLEITKRGHDAQLHTHPGWVYENGRYMSDYSEEQQLTILKDGADLLNRWVGYRPIAHRAGSFSANHNTLKALQKAGLKLDSSFLYRWTGCNLNNVIYTKNKASRLNGILELPVTVFRLFKFGSFDWYRGLDININTLAELKKVINLCKVHNIQTITILLHSFSFVKWDKDHSTYWANNNDIEKFHSILEYITKDPDLEIVTMKQFWELYNNDKNILNSDDYIPQTGFFLTYYNAWKNFHFGWRNKSFVLAPFFFFIIMVIVYLIV